MTKFASVFASCVIAFLVLTGCSDETNPDGSDEPTPTAPITSTSPTPTTPAWQDEYSKKEIAASEAALDRFATYEQRSEPIWRKGEATPAAEQLFKEYFQEGVWQTQMSRLRLYEEAKVEVHGTPTVLQSRPTRIALSKQSESVTIRQCVDYSTVKGFQNDKETTKVTDVPQVRIVVSSRSVVGQREAPWLISRMREFEGGRPCES